MRLRVSHRYVVLAGLLVASPQPLGAVEILLAAQVTQATVAGVVRDEETGRPLAGAVVALTDLNRLTATDALGRYVLRQVPAGPQHITVRFIGHSPRTDGTEVLVRAPIGTATFHLRRRSAVDRQPGFHRRRSRS
jgi:Carboxypeptidase regulatory-like domain